MDSFWKGPDWAALTEMHRITEQLRPQLEAIATIPDSVRLQMEGVDRALKEYALPAGYLAVRDEFADRLAKGVDLAELGLVSGRREEILREFEFGQHQIAESVDRFRLNYDADMVRREFLQSVGAVDALYESVRQKQYLFAEALQPYREYQEFALDQLRLAALGSEIARQNRLAVLDTAADLLVEIRSAYELSTFMAASVADTSLDNERFLNVEPNVFRQLGREIEDIDLEEEEEEEARAAVWDSCPAKVALAGARITELVYQINVKAERAGREPVFKPTTKNQYGCSVIVTNVASDEERFAKVIDFLYFLLYEGSGEAKRLTAQNPKKRLMTLWVLKDLRKGMRHDLDHGSPTKVRKNVMKVGEAFQSLIGAVAPLGSEAWVRAQLALYDQVAEMLEDVLMERWVHEVSVDGQG